jgi:hypothetical protein
MTKAWVRLDDSTVDALCAALTARGWEVEWTTDSYVEVWFPDPETGSAMRFSGWWLSWRLVDGRLRYGIGDDTTDLAWRTELQVPDEAAPDTVAEAADRAMHLLWHCDARDTLSTLYRERSRQWAVEDRMRALSRRLVVTPGMIRDALTDRP